MRVFLDCWFQYSKNGFVRSLYDLDLNKMLDYSANASAEIANILDHTLGKSLILSMSGDNVLISILGVMDSQESKKMNVILEDSNFAAMVGLYRYIYERYDNFTKILLDSVKLEKEKEEENQLFSFENLNNEIMVAKNSNLGIKIGKSKANELIFFEPIENYYEYQLNASEVFKNIPRDYSNTINAESTNNLGVKIGWLIFGLFALGTFFLKLFGII